MTFRIIIGLTKNSELSPRAFQRWGAARALCSSPELARAAFYSGTKPGCVTDAIGQIPSGKPVAHAIPTASMGDHPEGTKGRAHVGIPPDQPDHGDGAWPSEAGAVDFRELWAWAIMFLIVLAWWLW